ncbi:hypothetical protein D3C77_632740 [compost metagenome]
MVTEYGCTVTLLAGGAQFVGEVLAVEDVIAQDEAARVFANELFANDEGLCQAIRAWLFGVSQLYAILATVTQQLAERRQVFRCGDDQNFAHAGQHQH